jgi:aromatic ring-opening dioxygenase catalytic subunit (LigB family)
MAMEPSIGALTAAPDNGEKMPALVHRTRQPDERDRRDGTLWLEAKLRELILAGADQAIIQYSKLGRSARLAVPTPEHYLPLLYVLGARDESDGVAFFADKVTLGSMSMRSVKIG